MYDLFVLAFTGRSKEWLGSDQCDLWLLQIMS